MSSFKLSLASMFTFVLAMFLFSAARTEPENRWVAVAWEKYTNGSLASTGVGRHTKQHAIDDTRAWCRKHGHHCNVVTINHGCVYQSQGYDEKGTKWVGIASSADEAKVACESSGVVCGEKYQACTASTPPADEPTPENTIPMISGFSGPSIDSPDNSDETDPGVAETPRAAAPAPALDVSRGQPGYRADEDEGHGDAGAATMPKPKYSLRAEDTATLTKARDYNSFKLCPTNAQNHCYQFFNGVRPGRLISDQELGVAMQGLKGPLLNSGVDFSALLNGLNDRVIRYHFAHLAGKTLDHHVEGLFCAGYSEIDDPFPNWRYCAYVAEVPRYRTGD